MNMYLKAVLICAVALLAQHLGRFLYNFRGYGNDVFNHYPGKCNIVEGLSHAGSEDLTLLPSGHIIASSGLLDVLNRNMSHGALYLLDPSVSTEQVEKLNLVGLSEHEHFAPHGIDHWVHTNGSVSVFVVSHKPESVMRFLYDGKKTLTLTKVYQNSTYMVKHSLAAVALLCSLNSVLATGEDSFYASNIMSVDSEDRLMTMLQFILGLSTGSILYVEDDKYRVVQSDMLRPNGLAGNSRLVYVAGVNEIFIFSRLPDRTLELHKTIPINTGSMDNLKLDSDGDLWIGCQPYLYAVLEHMQDENHSPICPSEILRVKDPEGSAIVESIFKDDGHLLSASSVGVYSKPNRKLYIGTVTNNILVCDVSYLS